MQKLLYLIFFIQIAQASSQASQSNSPKSPSMSLVSNGCPEIEEKMSSEGYATIFAQKNGAREVSLHYEKGSILLITLKQTITRDGKTNSIQSTHDVARSDGSTVQMPFQLSTAFKTKFERLKDSMFKSLKENNISSGCFKISNEAVSLLKQDYGKRELYSDDIKILPAHH